MGSCAAILRYEPSINVTKVSVDAYHRTLALSLEAIFTG